MNKDGGDFMIEEYRHIASAFFDLQDKTSQWFRAYIALFGVPLTVLASVVGIAGAQEEVHLLALPEVVAGLLLTVALLGFFVGMTIVSTRMEMILYARTINDVRRFFAESDQAQSKRHAARIGEYLILPTCDTEPAFYEPWRSTFWQVIFIGFLNGLTCYVGATSLFSLPWPCFLFPAGVYWFAHWLIYWWIAARRERKWNVHHSKDLGSANY